MGDPHHGASQGVKDPPNGILRVPGHGVPQRTPGCGIPQSTPGDPHGELGVPLHTPRRQEYLLAGAGGRSTLSRYVASQAMAAPSPAGPGVPVVPGVPPAAPSAPSGPPGASCLMRSGVASMICRASVTTSAWGRGTSALACAKRVPSPGCPRLYLQGVRGQGQGILGGAGGHCHPPAVVLAGTRGAGGQRDRARALREPRWGRQAAGCAQPWGQGDTQRGFSPGGTHPEEKGGHGKRTGDSTGTRQGHKEGGQDKGDVGMHRERRSGGQRSWRGNLGGHTKMLGEDRGHGEDTGGKAGGEQ